MDARGSHVQPIVTYMRLVFEARCAWYDVIIATICMLRCVLLCMILFMLPHILVYMPLARFETGSDQVNMCHTVT
jgi:hypothetical protein